MSDQVVFWLGIKVFWWKRMVTTTQIFLGSSVLLSLLGKEQKNNVHRLLAESSQKARSVEIPPVIELRTILKWGVPVILLFSLLIAAFAEVRTSEGRSVSGFAVFLVVALFLGLLTVPVIAVITSASIVFTTFRVGKRFVPPMLEWLTHHERIDRSLVIIPFVLFVLVSLFGLYLS